MGSSVFSTKLLLPVLTLASSALGKEYMALWTKNDFITADLGGGTTTGHKAGFSIYDDNGRLIYFDDYPFGYAPVISGYSQYQYSEGCFGNEAWNFLTHGDFQGYPTVCEVRNTLNCPLSTAEGDGDLYFFGLGSGQSGYCAVTWTVPDGFDCSEGKPEPVGQMREAPAPPVGSC